MAKVHPYAGINTVGCEPCGQVRASRPTRPGWVWSYGVTTVPQRLNTTLPITLESLKAGGFDRPRLFIDGDPGGWLPPEGLEVTVRSPRVRAFGNWVLALWELYLRLPTADAYAIFQDDVVCYKNMRRYIELTGFPTECCYLNLYTFPQNHAVLPCADYSGWYKSNQRGLGAVALVFDRDAVISLLSSRHMAIRPTDLNRGWRSIDGGIVTAMNQAGYEEYVHMPSLVQHIGTISAIGNLQQPKAPSFRGADFDALDLCGTSYTA